MSEPQPDWKCPACGKTQVLKFARCQFCGTPAAPPHSEPSSLSGGTHHRSIAVQSDKATKQQMIAGVCLTLLGLAMEFSRPEFLEWAGVAISIVGLAVYARARRHSLANGTWGLIPILGPLVGLLYLSLGSRKTTNKKRSWAVAVAVVVAVVVAGVAFIGIAQVIGRHKVTAFYTSAKAGMLLVEVLDKHGGWFSSILARGSQRMSLQRRQGVQIAALSCPRRTGRFLSVRKGTA